MSQIAKCRAGTRQPTSTHALLAAATVFISKTRLGLTSSALAPCDEMAQLHLFMGRQWLHAKRAIVNLRKGQAVGKIVKEITVAAKLGGADQAANARLFAAVEKARKQSVTRDVIERAIKKGAGIGDDRLVLEHVVFEGYAPHKVPVIVEVMTDNIQRTAPEIRVLFKRGVLGAANSNKFLFEHVGLVEAHHPETTIDLEAAAIEAGANEFEPLTHHQNDDIPEGHAGVRFLTDRTAVHSISTWLSSHGWSVVTSEIGYVAKMFPELDDTQRAEVGEFLQSLEDNDDVHRVWAAVK
ncbi:MAG TPA: YebC/PmpR family DNA-binding transcriptional regulator [Opitutaceae bacterium]|nr:YebC/PmpR family DNA-binding transcriptional regulator [Opitutaceae bacterium]